MRSEVEHWSWWRNKRWDWISVPLTWKYRSWGSALNNGITNGEQVGGESVSRYDVPQEMAEAAWAKTLYSKQRRYHVVLAAEVPEGGVKDRFPCHEHSVIHRLIIPRVQISVARSTQTIRSSQWRHMTERHRKEDSHEKEYAMKWSFWHCLFEEETKTRARGLWVNFR
jgi:hypothetical protein